MKTLIITAHPSSKGFTHKIAREYKNERKQKGGEVVIMDLYNDQQYKQPFLSFEEVRGEWSGQEARKLIHDKITWADEIVFVYPIWWLAMPAMVKNFVDNNLTAGFAFKYENHKPVGLLTDKTVRLFITADGPKILYIVMKPFLQFTISRAIFGFCGMKVKSFDIFSDMRNNKDDAGKSTIFKKVRGRVLLK